MDNAPRKHGLRSQRTSIGFQWLAETLRSDRPAFAGRLRPPFADQAVQPAQIGKRFRRALFRRPWSEFFRSVRIERSGFQFQKNRIVGQGDDGMPGPRR